MTLPRRTVLRQAQHERLLRLALERLLAFGLERLLPFALSLSKGSR